LDKPHSIFIILGNRRTGSLYVQSLLNSHSHIQVFGEIFNRKFYLDNKPNQLPDLEGHLGKLCKNRFKDPVSFIDEVLYGYYGQDNTIGFRLFYEHIEKALNDRTHHLRSIDKLLLKRGYEYKIAYSLKELDTIKIVHLKRRNLLEQFYSMKRAVKTGQYVLRDPNKRRLPEPILIEYEELHAFFKWISRMYSVVTEFFNTQSMTDLYYENLVQNRDEEMKRIQEFLDVDHEPPQSKLEKIATEPLSKTIVNYGDLKKQFQGTPWYEFFKE
jgi:LPS sulfotransferase NodH